MPDVVATLKLVPGLMVKQIESSCCGMAGAFGYEAGHQEVSMRMAERDLLPPVRKAPQEAVIVADGTSCRYRIADGTGRTAVHVLCFSKPRWCGKSVPGHRSRCGYPGRLGIARVRCRSLSRA